MPRRLHPIPTLAPVAPRAPVLNPALLTVAEAARQLGVGLATARAWVAAGTLYSIPVGVTGKIRRVPTGEIERMRRLGATKTITVEAGGYSAPDREEVDR